MVKAAGGGTEVESGTCKDAVEEIVLEAEVCFEEGSKVINVVVVQVWGPGGEGNYKLVSVPCMKEGWGYM
jgi:hypothetical protein